MPTLADVVAVLDMFYDPAWAEPWDSVGLVSGDPDGEVRRVHLAIDPVSSTVREAIEHGADLLLTHHPLFMQPVKGVPATNAKGRLVHELIRFGCGLFTAHTNADVARPGVSDALATALGVVDTRPLLQSADHSGETLASVASGQPARLGLGRIGSLATPESLSDFAERVASSLPTHSGGIRVAGTLRRPVRRVAVCGGAGESMLEAATAAGADVLVTSDLRHHVVAEHRENGGPVLIDAGHWATEWPWLDDVALRLKEAFGGSVLTHVSTLCTDPWSAQLPSLVPEPA